MLPNSVTALITARRLERVPADLPSARGRLSRDEDMRCGRSQDRLHRDIEIGYLTAYDATRIAVTAICCRSATAFAASLGRTRQSAHMPKR